MTIKATQRILSYHTHSIIRYLNQSSSRINDVHIDAFRTCVYGILHQFFDRRCRPLNDLTRGNLIRNQFG
jgi:hypothetical protein